MTNRILSALESFIRGIVQEEIQSRNSILVPEELTPGKKAWRTRRRRAAARKAAQTRAMNAALR